MNLSGHAWLKDEGDILVIGVDVSGRLASRFRAKMVSTNFAYSIRDSVTSDALSFLIMSMLRGGDGHWRERRSLVLVSTMHHEGC